MYRIIALVLVAALSIGFYHMKAAQYEKQIQGLQTKLANATLAIGSCKLELDLAKANLKEANVKIEQQNAQIAKHVAELQKAKATGDAKIAKIQLDFEKERQKIAGGGTEAQTLNNIKRHLVKFTSARKGR